MNQELPPLVQEINAYMDMYKTFTVNDIAWHFANWGARAIIDMYGSEDYFDEDKIRIYWYQLTGQK